MKAKVVYKKSMYQIYVEERKNEHIKALLDSGDVTTQSMMASHESNERTIELVLKTLEKVRIDYEINTRQNVRLSKDEDIVFSIGGDGTFLWTQSYVLPGIPVFGINSDPGRSVGYLCVADMFSFETRLAQYLTPEKDKHLGWPTNRVVDRIQFSRNGIPLAKLILNDILFCHKHPASTSSYFLNGEAQKSSGIWICTPIGSSAAMKSAGGVLQQWHDKNLQYRVREPYKPSGKYTYAKGFIAPGQKLEIISKMRESLVCWDGSTNTFNVEMGDKIEIFHSPEPLTWVK